MRIVFFGSPALALPSLDKILKAGHQVPLIITQPDKPSGRGKKVSPCPIKKFAQGKNIPTYEPERIRKDELALEKIHQAGPEINVVVAYGQIIPASIIYFPLYKSINLHFSLLPKYRGASPVQWAILNGEKKTGITIFELNEKMDEGDLLAQKEVDIFPDENALDLENRLAEIGAELLLKTLSAIEKIKPVPQDHTQASYAPKLNKDNGRIDWTKEAGFIARQVRAFTPWPSAYTFFKEKRIIILKGKEVERKPVRFLPGKILTVQKEGIEVGCGNNTCYLISRLQPENKAAMDAYAFSLGTDIDPDDAFSL